MRVEYHWRGRKKSDHDQSIKLIYEYLKFSIIDIECRSLDASSNMITTLMLLLVAYTVSNPIVDPCVDDGVSARQVWLTTVQPWSDTSAPCAYVCETT